jgi:hypothetical protein
MSRLGRKILAEIDPFCEYFPRIKQIRKLREISLIAKWYENNNKGVTPDRVYQDIVLDKKIGTAIDVALIVFKLGGNPDDFVIEARETFKGRYLSKLFKYIKDEDYDSDIVSKLLPFGRTVYEECRLREEALFRNYAMCQSDSLHYLEPREKIRIIKKILGVSKIKGKIIRGEVVPNSQLMFFFMAELGLPSTLSKSAKKLVTIETTKSKDLILKESTAKWELLSYWDKIIRKLN